MPKLDNQHRLTIPKSLRDAVSLECHSDIVLCYDNSEKQIIICKNNFCDDLCIIDFKKIDSKGRISFSGKNINLLQATTSDMFVIFLKNGKLFVKKA